MDRSVFEANVKGLDRALEFLDKEEVIPLFIVAVRVTKSGLKTVILDCADKDYDADLVIGLQSSVLQSVAAKMRS